jgi:hypothetical protein
VEVPDQILRRTEQDPQDKATPAAILEHSTQQVVAVLAAAVILHPAAQADRAVLEPHGQETAAPMPVVVAVAAM